MTVSVPYEVYDALRPSCHDECRDRRTCWYDCVAAPSGAHRFVTSLAGGCASCGLSVYDFVEGTGVQVTPEVDTPPGEPCRGCGGATFTESYVTSNGRNLTVEICAGCGIEAGGDCECALLDGFTPIPQCDDCGEDKPDGARCSCEIYAAGNDIDADGNEVVYEPDPDDEDW